LGHKQDDESGLVYMRSRYYEPGSGRFLIQDPDKQGDNWFVYAADNPVSKIDSTGRDYFDDTVGLFQVLADYAAFLEFVKAYNTATSSLDIENAWGAFMTVWSGPDDTTTNGLLLKEMYGIASSFGDASDASSVTDALKEGALDGAQLIILSVAYDLRLEWYLNDIDDDD
jgi:RHS repeat-associated protein